MSKKNGRPSDYTPELGDKICALISEGQSLVKICKPDKMPSTVTVYAWLRIHKEFLNNYTRARHDQADHQFDEMIEIADECENDHAAIQKARLRIDTRKWAASKLLPKKYGHDPEEAGKNEDVTPESIRVDIQDASKHADA